MKEIFQQFGWWALMDILLMAIIIYYGLLLIKGTRTAQMLMGTLVVVAAFYASSIVPLTTVNWVMGKLYSSIVLIMIILFQDDIRHALRRIGKKPFLAKSESQVSHHKLIEELTQGAFQLAQKKVGALIVLERNIILSRYVEIGIAIDGVISSQLLCAIFHTASPIHDGAVIIQQGRVSAAGCFLPLTREENIGQNMGTRHRAAMGISQETDALVIIISEERGTVSLVLDGRIHAFQQTKDQMRQLLTHHLFEKSKSA